MQPSAAWTTDPIYTLSNDDTNEFPKPFGFAVNSSAGLVGVTMLFTTSTHMGSLQEYHTSNGDLVQTLNPLFPGSGMDEGYFDPGPSRDQERLVLARGRLVHAYHRHLSRGCVHMTMSRNEAG